MKTVEEVEKNIIYVTATIQEKFPELSKYLNEIPTSHFEKGESNFKNLKDYYNSLVALVSEYAKTHKVEQAINDLVAPNSSNYPLYPSSEDIYKKGKEEKDINPEDISKNKKPNESEGTLNEKEFEEDMSGDDLDVPGSELDDQQERIGSEDEENNFYSLGGDNHNDLEEDKG